MSQSQPIQHAKAPNTIEELCSAAETAAKKVLETHVGDPNHTDHGETKHTQNAQGSQAEYDRAWDDIIEFACRLSLTPTRLLQEIVGKIKIFRIISHEPEEMPTVEEQLLASILDDMQRLNEKTLCQS